MYKAARYFFNEFDGIEAIFRTGGCDLDTNRLERLNRYVSLSRRNSLFFGSHEGAKRGAAMGAKATADTCRDLLPDKWEKQ